MNYKAYGNKAINLHRNNICGACSCRPNCELRTHKCRRIALRLSFVGAGDNMITLVGRDALDLWGSRRIKNNYLQKETGCPIAALVRRQRSIMAQDEGVTRTDLAGAHWAADRCAFTLLEKSVVEQRVAVAAVSPISLSLR
jgi:hypothetical protein